MKHSHHHSRRANGFPISLFRYRTNNLRSASLRRYINIEGQIYKEFLMNEGEFIDYYELLQLSSNADTDTIERIFRHFAKKFHPDNIESGDSDRFRLAMTAYRTLSNPESRAAYDVRYQKYWNQKWNLGSEAVKNDPAYEIGNQSDFGDDEKNRRNLLSILYAQRRGNMKKPGVGDYELARLLGIPIELIEFHLWYLKAKGWVERLDTGQLAISALGVDQVERARVRISNGRMLAAGILNDETASRRAESNQKLFEDLLSSRS